MSGVVYPGSFDPITKGHYDIIKRCSSLFQEITVLVMINPDKKYMFTVKERIELIKQQCANIKNVRVCSYEGLLVEYMHEHSEKMVVKGVRGYQDFEYEQSMALINKSLDETIETLILFSDPSCIHVSSSSVKQLAVLGAPISSYVSSYVDEAIRGKLKSMDK